MVFSRNEKSLVSFVNFPSNFNLFIDRTGKSGWVGEVIRRESARMLLSLMGFSADCHSLLICPTHSLWKLEIEKGEWHGIFLMSQEDMNSGEMWYKNTIMTLFYCSSPTMRSASNGPPTCKGGVLKLINGSIWNNDFRFFSSNSIKELFSNWLVRDFCQFLENNIFYFWGR